MNYSKEEVSLFVSEDDVRFIRLAFCDVFGRQKNIAIMPEELDRAFEKGIPFDATSIEGFGAAARSDLFLKPDSSTLMGMPWRPDHDKVIRMLSDITYPNGESFECDTRKLLSNAIKKAADAGIFFTFGSEQEFYLFELDQNGKPSNIPYDEAGYMDIAPDDKGENIRREVCLTLERIGIHPENSHHERGPGQNEIDFRASDPLTAADNFLTFQTVVKIVARRNGLCADFSPLPLEDKEGNGFHVNISVSSKDGKDYLNQVMAGILKMAREMTIFLNPVAASYNRLGKNGAPRFVSWSEGNVGQLVRIPEDQQGERKAELRSPDAMANPYLAYALIIYAGLYGIENKLELPESVNEMHDEVSNAAKDELQKLPETLEEAKLLAKESAFIAEHIPKAIVDSYCK